VDLHLLDAEPTAEERAAVDALLGEPRSGWEGGEQIHLAPLLGLVGGHNGFR